MRYKEFYKQHGDKLGDPLELWFDDPNTTDEDMMEFLGPEPFAEHIDFTNSTDNVIGK